MGGADRTYSTVGEGVRGAVGDRDQRSSSRQQWHRNSGSSTGSGRGRGGGSARTLRLSMSWMSPRTRVATGCTPKSLDTTPSLMRRRRSAADALSHPRYVIPPAAPLALALALVLPRPRAAAAAAAAAACFALSTQNLATSCSGTLNGLSRALGDMPVKTRSYQPGLPAHAGTGRVERERAERGEGQLVGVVRGEVFG